MGWTNGSGDPKRVTATDYACDDDFREIAEALNRRRRILFFGEHDYSGLFEPDEYIGRQPIASHSPPPYRALRPEFDYIINNFAGLGGNPPTPADMHWLWPEADSDEDKRIITAAPEAGEVNFFARMNGTSGWTDPALDASTYIRTIHMNEMRWGIEHLRRGHLRVPIYFTAGLLSLLPDDAWVGETLANNGTDELRSAGYAILSIADSPPRGLADVAVRGTSEIRITASEDCTVELGRCIREIDFADDPPTWNKYAPNQGLSWDTPGGDYVSLGTIALAAGVPGVLAGQTVQAALQEMVDGAPQNFLARRADTGYENIQIAVEAAVEFDLSDPPN